MADLTAHSVVAAMHRNAKTEGCFGVATIDGYRPHKAHRASAVYMDGLLCTYVSVICEQKTPMMEWAEGRGTTKKGDDDMDGWGKRMALALAPLVGLESERPIGSLTDFGYGRNAQRPCRSKLSYALNRRAPFNSRSLLP